MNNINNFEEKYCCGCGLCNNFKEGSCDEKGYFRPNKNLNVDEFDKAYCYCNAVTKTNKCDLWGEIKEAYYGYSTNDLIRKKASSGGVLTAIACFILRKKIVDCVIQIKVNDKNPLTTETVWSSDENDVIKCCGSRYTASLIDILSKIDLTKKYAVIGKPCDIRVLREYISRNKELSNIIYLLTFFCAGTPSKQANLRLISKMDIDEKELKEFSYRGNGWPGKTTGITNDGKISTTEYEESWGKILGRDIQNICRFCWEGVGEAADISCGDGWYLKDNKPDFEEKEGRNIILARTIKGNELLNEMFKSGEIKLEKLNSLEEIRYMQPGQYMRKSSMFASILAMRIMRKKAPKYKLSELRKYSKNISLKDNLRIFIGTLKRILNGKIT